MAFNWDQKVINKWLALDFHLTKWVYMQVYMVTSIKSTFEATKDASKAYFNKKPLESIDEFRNETWQLSLCSCKYKETL